MREIVFDTVSGAPLDQWIYFHNRCIGRHVKCLVGTTVMLLFLIPSLIFGANRYWSGTKTWNVVNANWGTGTGGPYTSTFPSNSDAFFGAPVGTVTVSAPNNPRSMTFTVTGYTLASNTLTLNGASINTNANNATISSIIAGTVGLTKTGSGTLVLLTATNTYSGGTTINAGTIQVGDGTNIPSFNASAFGTGTVTVNSGTIWLNPKGTAIGTVFNFANSFSVNGGTICSEDNIPHLATGGGATFAEVIVSPDRTRVTIHAYWS